MAYLKKLIEIRSLNTKQRPAGLSPRIIPPPPVSPPLPKDCKISRFDQSYLDLSYFIKGMCVGVLFIFQKNRGGDKSFPRKKRLL